MKKYYLSFNKKNRFIKDEIINLHGEKFYGCSFLFYNEKYGATKLYDLVKRDGKEVVGLTIYFPVSKSNFKNKKIPNEILELDKLVKINGK